MTFFTIIYFLGFISFSLIRGVYSRQFQQTRDVPDRLDRFFTILPIFGMLVFPLIYALTSWLDFANYLLPVWAGWLGVVIYSTGLWLLWRSHADLGRQWSVNVELQDEHNLVTHGVYSRMRHPMYSAHLLWGLAQPLLLWNWVAGYTLLVFMLPLLFYRIPREERMMVNSFGEEYQDYIGRTGRFFPKI